MIEKPPESPANRIRSAIAEIIANVTNVGSVHSELRYISKPSELAELYRYDRDEWDDKKRKLYRGFAIQRAAAGDVTDVATGHETLTAMGRQARPYSFQIVGHSSFLDGAATEEEFEAVVDAVMDQLDRQHRLGGKADAALAADGRVLSSGPSRATAFEFRQLAGILCHYVEITFNVIYERSVAYGD